MDGLAFDEIVVLGLADLVLDFVDRELLLEIEQVVEELDAQAGEMVEQVGVGPVLLVDDVGQGKKLFLGFEQGLLGAGEADLALAKILGDAEGNAGAFEDVGIKAVFAQRLDQLDEMIDLTRINDAEPVDVPVDGVADLIDPPVVVFAETDYAPFELWSSFRHNLLSRVHENEAASPLSNT